MNQARCLTNCKFYCKKKCIKLDYRKVKLGSFCNFYKKQNFFEKIFKNFLNP